MLTPETLPSAAMPSVLERVERARAANRANLRKRLQVGAAPRRSETGVQIAPTQLRRCSASSVPAAPPLQQWGWPSGGSLSSLSAASSSGVSDLASMTVDGFWDGPDWEEEGDAWDRFF